MTEIPAAQLPEFAIRWVNLAQPRLGASAIAASDDFFAPKDRMLKPEEPVFIAGKYDENGKWMDGWESRRKRGPGHDWCIVRLGLVGRIKGVDIDTRHFTGNYPPEASIDACWTAEEPDNDTEWIEIVPRMGLSGDSHHFVEVADDRLWSHVRLNIFPDGGVARLRVYGEAGRDWSRHNPEDIIDLVAIENGGRPIAWNDAHFGTPQNMILPGRGLDMGDGWETRRRRNPGHDWCILALGRPGTVKWIEVDTAHFKGNYPDQCSIQAARLAAGGEDEAFAQADAWPELLRARKLFMDRRHVFTSDVAELGPISHVRLNIFPDGGISRLRLYGTIVAE